MSERKCQACGKTEREVELIDTAMFPIWSDQDECIAEFSGWNTPAEPPKPATAPNTDAA